MHKRTIRFGPVLTPTSCVLVAAALLLAPCSQTIRPPVPVVPSPQAANHPASVSTAPFTVLVDDFIPQPYQGDSVYYYNRVNGDRGVTGSGAADWGWGAVTTTISSGTSGIWMSLNHPIRENLPVNFSALCPAQVLSAYQSQVTGLTVQVARGTPGRTLKLELKNGNELRWAAATTLSGGQQILFYDLPPLADVSQLAWVLDQAATGDFVVVSRVSFSATTQITDVAQAAFVWSYCMLLDNWNPDTGLVRDKAKDASGEFDALQATGSLAAATAMAYQQGVIARDSAIQIVTRISDTLLTAVPRYRGLWPHWVKKTLNGLTIAENTEWSSVDTAIAALGLLEAQSALELDTTGVEKMLQAIDWDDLMTTNGISHGYYYDGSLIPFAWDAFGGESWLMAVIYSSATHKVPPIKYSQPPTANGSGFIDELAWLFIRPLSAKDYWGVDWTTYRTAAAETQIAYYPSHYPTCCFSQLGLFGLSAGEVPDPAMVTKAQIYQAFGVGGRFSPANDGSALLGAPVVAPHYSAMIAPLYPQEAIAMWSWLINQGHFSPLNNVESLIFPTDSNCDDESMQWNDLKGSWNLALQTLGWGRYLAEQRRQTPILWQAATANTFLQTGYRLLTISPQVYLPVIRQNMAGDQPSDVHTQLAFGLHRALRCPGLDGFLCSHSPQFSGHSDTTSPSLTLTRPHSPRTTIGSGR
jgi:hypothetical protein